MKQHLQVEVGVFFLVISVSVAHSNSWEEWPEWNSFGLVLTGTWDRSRPGWGAEHDLSLASDFCPISELFFTSSL